MSDEELASLVATDLRAYLREIAPSLDGPVSAVSLWTDDLNADFLVSIATQARFDLLTSGRGSTATSPASGPAAVHWSSAEWDVSAESFLAGPTVEALEPLAEAITSLEGDLDEVALELATVRWDELGFRALELARPLELLEVTPTAVAYVEMPDIDEVEAAEAMLRTVSAERLHELFPEWRELAREMQVVGDDDRLRQELFSPARLSLVGSSRGGDDEPSLHRLNELLAACGLYRQDLTGWTDRVQRALAIAATS